MADLQVKEIIKQMISYSSTEALGDIPINIMDHSFISQNEQTYPQILETEKNVDDDAFEKTMASFRSKLVKNP